MLTAPHLFSREPAIFKLARAAPRGNRRAMLGSLSGPPTQCYIHHGLNCYEFYFFIRWSRAEAGLEQWHFRG